jgi:hypothetical protein
LPTEISTVVSDGALALVAAALGWRLRRVAGARWWVALFLFSALAALLGVLWHGWHGALGPRRAAQVWRVTLYALGGGSFALLAAALEATVGPPWRRPLLALGAAKLAVYLCWASFHGETVGMVLDSGASLAFGLALYARAWAGRSLPGAGWIVAGLCVSALAGCLLAAGLGLHRHFNHNDLYHALQMLALALVYRGVRARGR